MTSKRERYFSGAPSMGQGTSAPPPDPSKPLPGEISPARKKLFQRIVAGVLVGGLGVVIGLGIAPEGTKEQATKIAKLQNELAATRATLAEVQRTFDYTHTDAAGAKGMLSAADLARHERQGGRYVAALRRTGAQAAADLMQWFINRWDNLLRFPQPDDRVGRRAVLLTMLVTGMAKDLNPDDFVPWQAEFFSGKWLGELGRDINGDGLPGPRSGPNRKDGFADVSACQIAMALNQSVTDAHVLIMPDMRCDDPHNRLSVVLGGATWNDALNELVKALHREGFLVVQRNDKGVRLILIGNRS